MFWQKPEKPPKAEAPEIPPGSSQPEANLNEDPILKTETRAAQGEDPQAGLENIAAMKENHEQRANIMAEKSRERASMFGKVDAWMTSSVKKAVGPQLAEKIDDVLGWIPFYDPAKHLWKAEVMWQETWKDKKLSAGEKASRMAQSVALSTAAKAETMLTIMSGGAESIVKKVLFKIGGNLVDHGAESLIEASERREIDPQTQNFMNKTGAWSKENDEKHPGILKKLAEKFLPSQPQPAAAGA